MTTDSQATAPGEIEAPASADTAPSTDDTAKNTQASPPVDWQARYKAAQAELTRTKQEAAILRRAAEDVAEDEDEEQEVVQPRKRGRNLQAELEAAQARAEAAEWVIAESVYGGDAIEDYNASAELFNEAQTVADHLAAFEAYHQRRMAREGRAAPPAPAAPAREQAVQPRVDSNRVDLLPNEVEIEEAARKRDGPGFVGALFRRAGVE